jgi:hypothetical protein
MQKNVASFEDLISFCTGYGATYNPSKAALKLPTEVYKIDRRLRSKHPDL